MTNRMASMIALASTFIGDGNNGNQGGGGFGGGNDPFQQSGNNIWAQQNANNQPNQNQQGQPMAQPNMSPNGMPAGTNNPNPASTVPNQQSHIVPGQQQGQPGGQQSASPLDKFNSAPDNSNQGMPQGFMQQGQQAPAATPPEAPKNIFDTDLKGWEGVSNNVDPTAGVDPERVALALGGDQAAFMEILQQVSRSTLANAAHMSSRVAGNGVNAALEKFGTTVPGMINDHQFSNMWQGDSVMNHESSKPMVEALTAQFRGQHPNATPQQIQEHVKTYFNEFTNALKPAPTKEPDAPATGNMSVGSFFAQPQ